MSTDIIQARRESAIERERKERAREEATKKARKLKRVEQEIVRTIGATREFWRRVQPTPIGLPTPERARKATALGQDVIDGRMVRRVRTNVDLMQEHGHLPRYLRAAIDRFAQALAVSMNVAIAEGQGSTARLISGVYDGMPPDPNYGPKDLPSHVLYAQYLWRTIEAQMPEEMMQALEQVLNEELGLSTGRPLSLSRFGNMHGWAQEQQARAAGQMMIFCAAAVLHHHIKKAEIS
jgi:hypothetical protein